MIKQFKARVLESLGPLLQGRFSYAQEGEDLALDRLLEHKRNGFYIEVGCHHPIRFSNTYFFYKRGWSGVCIDPLPGTAKQFKRWRPRDQVAEVGVSQNPGTLLYYMFNEPALNTFDMTLAEQRDGLNGYKLENKVSIPTKSLTEILDGMLLPGQIDFLSVDVEGLDLDVLKSNDWTKYRPAVIVAEALTASLIGIELDSIVGYLGIQGYRPVIKTGCSLIFTCDKHE
jgi:FkbM family methyltransferase